MSLTGWPLLMLVGVLTVIAPVLVVITWRRTARPPGAGRALGTLGRLLAVVCCQVLAVSLTFIVVNRSFVFYSSWGDLFGTSASPTTITTANLVRPGDGRVEVMEVHGAASKASGQILIWLPPQYDDPAYAKTSFPVTMMLPGQPSTPEVTFAHFDFAAKATQAIRSQGVKPFIAVFPPLMTNPPRDTECTDVPNGPQAETWLTTDVRNAVLTRTRATPDPKLWSVMGYSTGAFCAVKLLLRHPNTYLAAAGFAGYYQPITDHTTGNLFRGSKIRYDENSPLWLYGQQKLAAGHKMLLISGRQDASSWPETQKMLQATRGDPSVSSLTFATGGHNYRNYRNSLPQVLQWLTAAHAFG